MTQQMPQQMTQQIPNSMGGMSAYDFSKKLDDLTNRIAGYNINTFGNSEIIKETTGDIVASIINPKEGDVNNG